MSITVTMLGSGSSVGVPEIGCRCKVCTSTNPKNRRTRVSVLVETQGKSLLIDTSPDLRQQALDNNIQKVDAVLYTHDHADHIHGIDDIRLFNVLRDGTIPVYADPTTLRNISQRFAYCFGGKPERAWYRPALEGREIAIDPPRPFTVEGVEVTPFLQTHASMHSLGFRIGNFAYSTDVNHFTDEALAELSGLDVWIVDCLRYTPSYTHSRLEITLEWIDKVKPKLAVLTHMAHQIDYDEISRELPTGVVPGYDGLKLHSS